MCNAHVDCHAKDAANAVPISQSELAAYVRAFKGTSSILRASAKMLALWPASKQLYGTLPRSRAYVPTAKATLLPNNFVWNGKCWVCTHCLRHKLETLWTKVENWVQKEIQIVQ